MAKGYRGGFPGGGSQMNMMKQAQKMQQDFMKMQQELESKEFEFSSGGAVKAVMVGTRKLQSITIDPEVLDRDDVEMLQDLILTAVNGAIKLADEETGKAMNKLQGGLGGFPGLF